MAKFLKDGEKLTKQNFVEIFDRYRAVVKDPIDREGKTDYQIAKENGEKKAQGQVYNRVLLDVFAKLSKGKKQEIFSKLEAKDKQDLEIRAKNYIKDEMSSDKDYPAQLFFDKVATDLRKTKGYDAKLDVLRPFLSKEEMQNLEENVHADRPMLTLMNLGPDRIKLKYLNAIRYAENGEKARDLAKPFLGEEKLKEHKFQEYEMNARQLDSVKDDLFRAAADELGEEEIEALGEDFNSRKPLAEKSWEEVGTHFLAEDTAKMIEKVNADNNLSPKEKQAAVDNMTKINAETIRTTSLHINAVNDLRKDTEEALSRDAQKTGNAMLREQGIDPAPLNYDTTLKEGKQADYDKLSAMDIQYSKDTKKSIKEVFAKFEKYGYAPNGIQQEEGFKQYALSAYGNAMTQYQQALQRGDVQESVRLAGELDKHNKQIHDILKTVNDKFPSKEGDMYPGNVDVLRNEDMPEDLRKDVRGVSKLNGLYAMYGAMKEAGVDVDEFLEHPVQHIRNMYDEAYDVNQPMAQIEGQSGADAIFKLTTVNRTLNKKLSGWGVPRVVESMASLEDDPKMKANNYATSFAFFDNVYQPYAKMISGKEDVDKANKETLDRFLLVKGEQVDDKLLSGTYYDPKTAQKSDTKGFDEAEYLSKSAEKPSEFFARLKENVIGYMSRADLDEEDRGLTNSEFVQIAQKAAVKFLMVKGTNATSMGQTLDDIDKEQEAISSLQNFITNGAQQVDQWIDEEYVTHGDPERPVLDEKAGRLKNSYVCTNPYRATLSQFDTAIQQAMAIPGNVAPYAADERAQETIDDKKAFLTTSFRNGEVPESFYRARMKQLNEGRADDAMPPFFAADDLKGKEDYIEDTYGDGALDELSTADKDNIYDNYINRAREEKRNFLVKQYMKQQGLVRPGQFFTMEEMDKMYPTINLQAHEEERERIAQEAEAKRQSQEREKTLPHEERIKLVREGEKFDKYTFPDQMSRFIANVDDDVPRGENETEVQWTHRKEINKGDKLRRSAFAKKLNSLLTPAQKEELVRFAPAKGQKEVRRIIFKGMEDMIRKATNYYDKSSEAMAIGSGPRKTQLEAELKEINDTIESLDYDKISIDDARRICSKYLTPEQLNDPKLSVSRAMNSAFYIQNHEYVGKEVANMLTQEQLNELNQTVQNYVLPWDRTHEEMGEKAFTAQTEQAKAQIDQMAELNGKPLTEEEKTAMKADLDAANDFLRKPKGEDPYDAYFTLNTDYEHAALHDGSAKGEVKVAEEGLKKDAVETVINPDTGTADLVVAQGNADEQKKWEEAEFKYSPKTKQAIKQVFAKMKEYGYGGKGIIGEEGQAKEYGLSALARKIDAYREATRSGDPIRMATASKEMMEEKAHVDEMLAIVQENFPCDRHSDNYAKSGNIDVVRNGNYPPEYRYNDAVTPFNALFIMMNFAEANGIDPDEFLEHPSKYFREFYLEKANKGLNVALKDKTGGAALFEATKSSMFIPRTGYGSSRAMEALYFLDNDPEVRAHNHGLGDYLEKTVSNNAEADINRRNVAYTKGHVDRYLFVDEPMDPATILGVPVYNSKTLSYDQPKPFNELEYLQNNGKSIGEMKELLDKNIKEYLYQNRTQRTARGDSFGAINANGFLEIAQKAASKVLLAKHLEKDDPAYGQLKGLLTNGQEYVNDLIAAEKAKVEQAERRLANAKEGLADVEKMIDEKINAAAEQRQAINPQTDPELMMLTEIKEQRTKEINEYQTYLDKNAAYKEIAPDMAAKSAERKYVPTLDTLEQSIADMSANKRPAGTDLKPDEDFNKAIVTANTELATIDSRIDARLNEIVSGGAAGNINHDDQIQILGKMKEDKIAEIAQKKADYLAQLDRDVESGRIPASFKEARVNQINDPNYKYNDLPAFFPKDKIMTKDQYVDFLKDVKHYDLNGYDEADKAALYEVYVADQNARRDREIEAFAIRNNAAVLGFVETKQQVAAPQQAQPQAEAQVEQQRDFSGKWFQPGTNVTKDMLLDKFSELEGGFVAPIEGDDWLKNREALEARETEQARMNSLFEEGWKTLSAQSKQEVFDAMRQEEKTYCEGQAIHAYVNLLKANGKSAESKAMGDTIFAQRATLSLAQVEQMASGFLTNQEKATPSLKAYNHIKPTHIAGVNPDAWEPFVNGIPDNEFKNVVLKAETKKMPNELTLEESIVPRYGNEVGEVKNIIDNMSYRNGQPLTNEGKADIKNKLDRAQSLLADLSDQYVGALASRRRDREESTLGMNRTRTNVARQNLQKDGVGIVVDDYNTANLDTVERVMVQPEGGENESVRVVSPEGAAKYQELKERKFLLRPETKQGLKDIFAKFEAYGYDQVPFDPEEGIKVYALRRYHIAAQEFRDKLSSADPVEKAKAVDAADKMLVEYERVKELSKEVGDLYGVKEGGYYPGNMDVEREKMFPPEFRNDIAGISALNGLYVMYRTLKQKNVNIDEFLDDPRKHIQQEVQKVIDKVDPNRSIKGKSGAEAMFEAVKSPFSIDSKSAMMLGRSIENIAKMEKDPALREHNIGTELAHMMTDDFALNSTSQRNTVSRTAANHLDRFLMVKDAQQDASLTGAPTLDYDTMTVIPAREFDEVEYLANQNEDPKAYADRVLKEGTKFIAMLAKDKDSAQQMSSLEVEIAHGIKAMQSAATKFLAARPDIDKSSEAYRTLNSLSQNGPQFIKAKMTEMVAAGQLDADVDDIDFDSKHNFAPEQSLADFKKSNAMKTFGDAVRTADKAANRDLKNLQADLVRAQTARNRAVSEVAKAQADQQIQAAQQRLDEAVANRKAQLMEDFRAGRITEEYLDKRNAQLDGNKFNEDVPKMFEADNLMSKNDYLRKKYPDDFAQFSNAEKNELYQRYVDNAKREKDHYIAKKYLEEQGFSTKSTPKTKAERQAAEDQRLARQEQIAARNAQQGPQVNQAQPQMQQNAPHVNQNAPQVNREEPQINHDQPQPNQNVIHEEPKKPSLDERIRNNNGKVEINLDEEDAPEMQENEKINDAGAKVEVKEDEKVADNGGVRVDIDLDDDDVELNNDILNFGGNQPNLDKDPLKK